MRTFSLTLSLLGIIGGFTAAGCGSDDASVDVTLELVARGPGGSVSSFPAGLGDSVNELTIRTYSGKSLVEQRIVDVREDSLKLPPLPFGEDVWVSVEAAGSSPECENLCVGGTPGVCDDGGTANPLFPGSQTALTSLCQLGTDCTDCGRRTPTEFIAASGASRRLNLSAGDPEITVAILMTPAETFSPAYFVDSAAGATRDLLYEFEGQERAGFASATLPDESSVILVGGARYETLVNATPENGLGGLDDTGMVELLNTIQVYSVATGQFLMMFDSSAPSSAEGEAKWLRLPTGLAFATATALDDSHVLIVGGLMTTNAGSVEFLETSNAAYLLTITALGEGTLEPVGGAPIFGRALHTATMMENGDVVIAGGITGRYLVPAMAGAVDVARFEGGEVTIDSGVLSIAPRALHTATQVDQFAHGILLTGGRSVNGLTTNSEVLYQSGTGLASAPFNPSVGDVDLVTPRFGHTASLYTCPGSVDPYVAVAGGYTEIALGQGLLAGLTPTATIEVYDAGSFFSGDNNVFAFLPPGPSSLSVGRAYASAAALPLSSDLLVVGGFDAAGRTLRSADRIYNADWTECGTLEIGPVPIGGLSEGRALGALFELSNQLMLYTGGTNGQSSVELNEFFNPGDYGLPATYPR